MKKWQKITLIGCSTCMVLAISLGIVGLLALRHLGRASMASIEDFVESRQWTTCRLPHPGETPALTFMQKSFHPFLAEYDYRIRIGTGSSSVERWLPTNCGGRTRMNAYWYPEEDGFGPCIRLQDHWGEYLLRFDDWKTYRMINYKNQIFIEEITDGSEGYSMDEHTLPDGEQVLDLSVGNNRAIDITNRPVAQGTGKYFGRIDGTRHPLRFVTASEAPEAKIEMVR